jgi:hypothetical protein
MIPAHRKQIPSGTFYSILKQSGLSKEDFKKRVAMQLAGHV